MDVVQVEGSVRSVESEGAGAPADPGSGRSEAVGPCVARRRAIDEGEADEEGEGEGGWEDMHRNG